jgi:hypothetical protein
VSPRLSILNLRQKSLARGVVMSLCSFAVSLRLAGFPYIQDLHGSRWQIVVLLAASWGMGETARCMGPKWNLYHAGVLLLLYANLMILAMIVFLVAYP